MRAVGQFLGYALIILVLPVAGSCALGPYDAARLTPNAQVSLGDDVDAYLASRESAFDDITPGTEKRIVWAGMPDARTEWVVLYVHGFSATSEEIRPVPNRLANSLGANLIYTRLQGHGRGSDALAEGTVQGWVNDFAQAMQAARVAGDKIIVLSTSTGGTFVTAMAQNCEVMAGAVDLIFVSPNYGLNNPLAPLLRWPAARYWLPRVRAPAAALNHGMWTMAPTGPPNITALP